MKNILSLLFITFTTLFVSCADPYDDTDIRNDLENLKERVTALEKLCKKMNSNISAMQTILDAVQNNDYVTAVNPITENGVVIGYTVNFTKSSPITIYHGKNGSDGKDGTDGVNGKDGYTPIVGVKQDADGIYYWTLDGEWLTDENGNRIKAVGTDGKDGADGKDGNDGANGEDGIDGKPGEDGITPQLKIENGFWHISYDNGISWMEVGKATGEDGKDGANGENGDSFFNSVDTSNDDYVIFILSDDTTIKLPTWYAFEQLKTQCNQMNSNINAMQVIVNALQNNDYVTSVAPVLENGKTIGYTINFTKSNPITIYHGSDGKDGTNGEDGMAGHTPIVGVRKDADGNYYWTLDGEWLTDDNGDRIKAVGTPGKDGESGNDGQNGTDGITPQFKIENGYWYISYDNGTSWKELGKATGENGTNGTDGINGDSFFKSITQDEDYIYMTLADGTVYTLPKDSALNISFNVSDWMAVHLNSTHEIAYTVECAASNVTVDIISSADIKAKVVTDNANGKSGKIVINTGDSVDEYSKVIVLVSDGKKVILKSISFEQARISFNNSEAFRTLATGGILYLYYNSNVDFEISIPASANDWIEVRPETRHMSERIAALNIKPNLTFQKRTATVKLMTPDGKLSVDVEIEQEYYKYMVTTPRSEGWLANDYISIFPAVNQNFRFMYSGVVGNTSGSFTYSNPATASTARKSVFAYHSADQFAVFPYKEETSLEADGVISTTFDAEQNYVANGWERKNNIMISRGNIGSNDDIIFNFQPLTAFICLELNIEPYSSVKTIETLSITSNAGEALAGTANIETTYTEISSCQVSGTSTVTMKGVNGVTLNDKDKSPTRFYFAVPPVNLSEGLTIRLTDTYAKERHPHTYVINENIDLSPGEVYTIPHTFDISYYFPIDKEPTNNN